MLFAAVHKSGCGLARQILRRERKLALMATAEVIGPPLKR
jgi:hypothetical protein